MKKSIKIQIPEPCHENWDKMTASAQSRFCNACSRVVVDFSVMSDKEVFNYISNTSSKICGRVSDDQLNRPIQMPFERKRISLKYLWSLLISSFLVTYKTHAQGRLKVDSIRATMSAPLIRAIEDVQIITVGMIHNTESKRPKHLTQIIRGKVTTENGEAVPCATVSIPGSKQSTITDTCGEFKLTIRSSFRHSLLSVTSVGYEAVSVDFKKEDTDNVAVVLATSKAVLLDEVKVTAYTATNAGFRLGGVSYGVKISENQALIKLKEFIGRNEIKIFPNPVSPGSSVNLSFNIAETGNYKLEFFDTSGKIMYATSINIPAKKYVMNMGSNLPLIPGMYFVKILSAHGKKVYDGSLLVQ
jgi:hypothetical protein